MQIKVYVSNREGRKVILSSRDQQKVVEISLFPEKIVLTLQGIDFNNPVGKELVSGAHPTQTSLLQSIQLFVWC